VSQRRISDPELAEFWRMDRTTLSTWHTHGVLTSDGRDGEGKRDTHWYLYSTITGLHRKGLHNKKATIPAVSALLRYEAETGKPSLLTTAEVATRLDVSQDAVFGEIYAGALVAFKLPGDGRWRVPVQSLAAYQTTPDTVRRETVAKIIGVREDTVSVMMAANPPLLERVTVRLSGKHPQVSTQSLLAFIDAHLVHDEAGESFLTAQEWWKMRELYEFEELLSLDQIKARFHTHYRVMQRLIKNGEFPCLYTTGGQARIPLHAVQTWNATRIPVTAEFLARAFGISKEEAARFIASPTFCVRRHGKIRPSVCPTVECVTKYVAANRLGVDFDADDWIAESTQGGMQHSAHEIGGSAIYTESIELRRALGQGRLPGVLLPGGTQVAVATADWPQIPT